MKTNYSTTTCTVDSGEWLAEVEVILIPGSKGDYWTPGESDSFEIVSGHYYLYDEETGETLMDEKHDISTFTHQDMKFLENDISEQLDRLDGADDFGLPDPDEGHEYRGCHY